jgi:hypothetical protein
MTIADRIAEALDWLSKGNAEAALLPLCSAIDATAARCYGTGGRRSYKEFLHENLSLMTSASVGPSILNIRLQYDHPKIECASDGTCTIEEVIYHAVRCGLSHKAQLPDNLKFTDERTFGVEDSKLVLPFALLTGLIIAVVVAPANAHESIDGRHVMNFRGLRIPLNELWGKRQRLIDLFAVTDASTARADADQPEGMSH